MLIATLIDGTEVKLNATSYTVFEDGIAKAHPQRIFVAATDSAGARVHVHLGYIVRVVERTSWP